MSLIFAVLVSVATAAPADPPADRFARWEQEITGIEKRLQEMPPKKGGLFFVGSSSIKLWKLVEAFPGAVNVGFGGSVIKDSTHFAPRILLPHEPAAIVFYAGDNDIASRRSPEQVLCDFRAFAEVVHAKLPKARILFLAIKPSIKRWELFEQQKAANAQVKEYCDQDERLHYLDLVPLMLRDGKPDPELFVKDGLHLSDKGYALWNEHVQAALKKIQQ